MDSQNLMIFINILRLFFSFTFMFMFCMDVFYNLMHFLIQVHQSTSSYDPCIFGNQIITRNMNTYNAPNMSRPFVPKPDRWRLNRGSANHLTMILLESSEVSHFPPFMKYVNASVSLECWMLDCVVIGPGAGVRHLQWSAPSSQG